MMSLIDLLEVGHLNTTSNEYYVISGLNLVTLM